MNNCQQIQVQENQEINEDLEEMPANPIFVPTFINKQKQSLDLEIYQYNNKDNNNNNNQNLKPVDINQKLKNLTISQEINQAKYEVESPKPLQTKIEESTPNQQIISYQSSMMVSPINSQQQKYDFTMKSVFNQELQSNFSLHTIKQPLNHHQNLANTNNSQSCLEKQNFIQTPSVLSPKYQQQIQDEQSITKNNQDSQMLADQSSQDQQIINTDQNQQFYTEGDSIIERLPNEENKEVSQKENTNKYRMQSLFRPPQYFQTSARNQTNEKKLNHEGRKAQIEQNFFRKGTSLETRFNHQNNKDQLDQNFYIQNLQNIYNQHMKNKIQDIIFRMRKRQKSKPLRKLARNFTIIKIYGGKQQQEQIQQQLQLNENQENIDEKAEVRNGEISIPAFEIKQKRQLDLEQSSENNNTLSSNYYQNCELKIENLTVSQEYEDNQNDTQSPINFSLQMKGKSLRQKMAQKQVQVIESSSKNEKKQQLRIQNYYENKNKHIEKFKFNSTQKLEQNLNTLSNNIDRQQITESPSLLSPIQSQQLLIKQSQSQQLTVMQNQSQLIEIEKNKGPDQLRNQKKTRENKQLFLDKFTMSSHKKNPSNFLNNQILLLKERQVDVVNYKTYLNQKFYIQNLQNINNEAKKKQIEDILFQINFFKKNEKNDWKKQHFSKIEQNIEEDMNIIKIMKDIIFLKKAIMMILTQDQLATLQLIGCSSTFLDLDVRSLNKSLEQLEKDNNLSHYESQLANLQSEKFIEENILKFLNRCSNSSNITNLDQRILFSLKKSYLN
ncbi:hypothetical protein ABPG73_008963 [Tetrahymena malaccensis]